AAVLLAQHLDGQRAVQPLVAAAPDLAHAAAGHPVLYFVTGGEFLGQLRRFPRRRPHTPQRRQQRVGYAPGGKVLPQLLGVGGVTGDELSRREVLPRINRLEVREEDILDRLLTLRLRARFIRHGYLPGSAPFSCAAPCGRATAGQPLISSFD